MAISSPFKITAFSNEFSAVLEQLYDPVHTVSAQGLFLTTHISSPIIVPKTIYLLCIRGCVGAALYSFTQICRTKFCMHLCRIFFTQTCLQNYKICTYIILCRTFFLQRWITVTFMLCLLFTKKSICTKSMSSQESYSSSNVESNTNITIAKLQSMLQSISGEKMLDTVALLLLTILWSKASLLRIIIMKYLLKTTKSSCNQPPNHSHYNRFSKSTTNSRS